MNKVKYGLLILCFLAGIGYFLPALNVNINIPSVYSLTIRINLGSLFSLFNEAESADLVGNGGNISGEYMREAMDGILELLRELHLESLVAGLAVSMVFYILVIFALAVMLILIFTEKLNRLFITMTAISAFFYIFIAFQIFRLPSKITDAKNKSLGVFAGFIDLSQAIKISLGFGFWLTFISIICMLSIHLYTFYKDR